MKKSLLLLLIISVAGCAEVIEEDVISDFCARYLECSPEAFGGTVDDCKRHQHERFSYMDQNLVCGGVKDANIELMRCQAQAEECSPWGAGFSPAECQDEMQTALGRGLEYQDECFDLEELQ